MITKKTFIKRFSEIMHSYFEYYDKVKLARPDIDVAKLLSDYYSDEKLAGGIMKSFVDLIWTTLWGMFVLGLFSATLFLLIIMLIIKYV